MVLFALVSVNIVASLTWLPERHEMLRISSNLRQAFVSGPLTVIYRIESLTSLMCSLPTPSLRAEPAIFPHCHCGLDPQSRFCFRDPASSAGQPMVQDDFLRSKVLRKSYSSINGYLIFKTEYLLKSNLSFIPTSIA